MSSGLTGFVAAVVMLAGGPGGFLSDTLPLGYLAARDRVEIGEPGAGLQHLERTLRNHPHHAPSVILAARLHRDQSGDTRAAGWIRRHLRAHPEPSLLGNVLEEVRLDTGVRLNLLEWADTAGLHRAGLLSRRLNILRRRGRWEAVYRLARRGRSRFPESYAVSYALGTAALKRGRPERARDVFRELIARRPGRSAAYRGLARSLLRLGRTNRARDRYAQYRALVPIAPGWSSFRDQPSTGEEWVRANGR